MLSQEKLFSFTFKLIMSFQNRSVNVDKWSAQSPRNIED